MINTLEIFNASAGSGKTYTLVYRILRQLMEAESVFTYQSILALTFTNKAANEMKERLLQNLEALAERKDAPWVQDLITDTGLERDKLEVKAKFILRNIVHDYSNLSVSTIDKFNLRLIRSFAKDLGLSMSFDVELDQNAFYQKTLDRFYDELEANSELTKALQAMVRDNLDTEISQFSLEKSLLSLVKKLNQDQNHGFVLAWENWTTHDLMALRGKIFYLLSQTEKELQSIGGKVLELIKSNNLQLCDFMGGRNSFMNYFDKLGNKNFKLPSTATYIKIANRQYYNKTAKSDVIQAIEGIIPQIEEAFWAADREIKKFNKLKAIIKQFNAFVLMVQFQKVAKDLKKEQDILLISEFNQKIFDSLRNEPSAFIFEGLGSRYKRYFLDEFQDTSDLQWQNLFPLIEDSLSAAGGDALLVGDPKQAIYAFRGGRAELMMEIPQKPYPFQVKTDNLPTNWRSAENIIRFNNSFFQSVGNILPYPDYAKLYQSAHQEFNHQKGGSVAYYTYQKPAKDEEDDQAVPDYFQYILQIIEQALTDGFSYEDMAILTRNNNELIEIAAFLEENTSIPVATDMALVLKNEPNIQMFVNYLYHLAYPDREDFAADFFLKLIASRGIEQKNVTSTILKYIQGDDSNRADILKEFNVHVQEGNGYGFYDQMEKRMQAFNFHESVHPYCTCFLEFALDFSNKEQSTGLRDFLKRWEDKKDDLSLTSNSQNSIRLMTLHKSKGLQFPVVIIPKANWSTRSGGLIWIEYPDLNLDDSLKFPVNYIKDFEQDEPLVNQVFSVQKSAITEELNLLYVGFTRAVHQLYFGFELTSKNELKGANSEFFAANLSIPSDQEGLTYIHEAPSRINRKKESITPTIEVRFESTPWQEKIRISLPQSNREQIRKGILLHDLLSRITNKNQIKSLLETATKTHQLAEAEALIFEKTLTAFFSNDLIANYFENATEFLRERDFITDDGAIIRPDLLLKMPDNTWVLMDYKTGQPAPEHHQQVEGYAIYLKAVGYEINKMYLIYLEDPLEIVEV